MKMIKMIVTVEVVSNHDGPEWPVANHFKLLKYLCLTHIKVKIYNIL